jgi:two-component system, chemotaxis family, chemotaxis protein CheY
MQMKPNTGFDTNSTIRQDLEPDEIDALYGECEDRIADAETGLMELAAGRAPASPALVNRLFRAFHGVKSAAGYLGHGPLELLSQVAENVLVAVRSCQLELTPARAALLLPALDRMDEMVAARGQRPDADFGAEIAKLKALPGESPKERPLPVPVPAAPARTGRLRVLVVEDDFCSRVLLQGMLSKYGECHVAVNGREAVDAFRSAHLAGQGYDLICLDIRMPEMDGSEALDRIRSIESSLSVSSSAAVKIFMTTGICDIKAVTASFHGLCDAYLFKPVEREKLEGHLRSFGLTG